MKRLYKSRADKMIAGVCGGIAEYFDIDPVIVRILFILFFFIGGSAIVAYIIGMIIIPYPVTESIKPNAEKSQQSSSPAAQNQPVLPSKSNASLIIGIVLVAIGAYFLMGNIPFLRGYYWWFRWHLHDFFVPGIFIVIGIVLVINSIQKK